jgi:hypothetical protein
MNKDKQHYEKIVIRSKGSLPYDEAQVPHPPHPSQKIIAH